MPVKSRITVKNAAVFAMALGGLWLSACGEKKAVKGDDSDKMVPILDSLYREYLTNDIHGARERMQRAMRIIDESNDQKVANHMLWQGHARLFLIEERLGNTNAAWIHYEKSRYWLLRNLETIGDSPTTIVEKLQAFSQDECRKWVVDWDKIFTAGKGAQFYSGVR